ncbi:MAG: FtsW/RodA/SpoVE family cell cycle protein, partial [Syntrophobacterales bacterium]
MIDRRLIQNFDWLLLLLTFAIMAVGLVTLYSALFSGGGVHGTILTRQIYWLGLGTIVMVLAFSLDYQWLERFAYPAYVIGIVLLVAVLIFGKTVSGSKRWLDLGPFAAQPSELMKPLLVIALARFFARQEKRESYKLRELALPALMVLVPVALIVLEPDLGTAALLLAIAASIILFVGVRPSSLL